MPYKTNLTKNKREQLKNQLDDFATFQWRGHDMFEEYGCFIINESKGSLKFYNGPGYSNQYAKAQFSSSVSGLLGVDFKQQTISMKIGMYWFTIEEYQNFLNEINPYVINYLTFGYEKEYGYLVKMGKIADSPRHIVGKNENGENCYYTELDLTWELLGDNCVRSNLPYEYKNTFPTTDVCTWELDYDYSDMKDNSLLDTPLLFELPLWFTSDNAQLKLVAQHKDIKDEIILFDVLLNNLSYTDPLLARSYTIDEIKLSQLASASYNEKGKYYKNTSVSYLEDIAYRSSMGNVQTDLYQIQCEYAEDEQKFIATVIFPKHAIIDVQNIKTNAMFYNYTPTRLTLSWYDVTEDSFSEIAFAAGVIYTEYNKNISPLEVPIKYQGIDYKYAFYAWDFDENRNQNLIVLMSTQDDFDNSVVVESYVFLTEQPSNRAKEIFIVTRPEGSLWGQYYNEYSMFIRYDSETGLMYVQEGSNDTWQLLNFQTDSLYGNYLLSSSTVNKFKIPGKFAQPNLNTTEWTFTLTVKNIDLTIGPQEAYSSALTIYSRKNIV